MTELFKIDRTRTYLETRPVTRGQNSFSEPNQLKVLLRTFWMSLEMFVSVIAHN